MAIVSCPECGKKIPHLAVVCLHCGFQRGELSDEQMLVYRRRRVRDHIYHLNMTSYAVITVFIAAFGWYWWDTGGFVKPSTVGPFILMGISALAYLVVRGLLFQARRKQRELKRMKF